MSNSFALPSTPSSKRKSPLSPSGLSPAEKASRMSESANPPLTPSNPEGECPPPTLPPVPPLVPSGGDFSENPLLLGGAPTPSDDPMSSSKLKIENQKLITELEANSGVIAPSNVGDFLLKVLYLNSVIINKLISKETSEPNEKSYAEVTKTADNAVKVLEQVTKIQTSINENERKAKVVTSLELSERTVKIGNISIGEALPPKAAFEAVKEILNSKADIKNSMREVKIIPLYPKKNKGEKSKNSGASETPSSVTNPSETPPPPQDEKIKELSVLIVARDRGHRFELMHLLKQLPYKRQYHYDSAVYDQVKILREKIATSQILWGGETLDFKDYQTMIRPSKNCSQLNVFFRYNNTDKFTIVGFSPLSLVKNKTDTTFKIEKQYQV